MNIRTKTKSNIDTSLNTSKKEIPCTLVTSNGNNSSNFPENKPAATKPLNSYNINNEFIKNRNNLRNRNPSINYKISEKETAIRTQTTSIDKKDQKLDKNNSLCTMEFKQDLSQPDVSDYKTKVVHTEDKPVIYNTYQVKLLQITLVNG